MQAAALLGEKTLIVACCEGDEDICAQAISELSELDITLSSTKLDKAEHIGGVNVMTANRKIMIENTFGKRLQLAYKKVAPRLSAILFQENSSLW